MKGGLLLLVDVFVSLLFLASVVHSQDITTTTTTTTTTVTTIDNGSQEWYVNSSIDKKCIQDCPTTSSSSPYCGGLSTWQITYPTLSECCIQALPNIVPGLCETNSQNLNVYGGSLKYYPNDSGDSQDKKCVQDCELGSDLKCGGIIEYVGVTNLYDSVEECCVGYFTWLDTDYCVDNSSELLFFYYIVLYMYYIFGFLCFVVLCSVDSICMVWGEDYSSGEGGGKDVFGMSWVFFHNHYFWNPSLSHTRRTQLSPPFLIHIKILTRLARTDTFKTPPVADTASRIQLHAHRARNYVVVPPPPQSYTMTLPRVVHHTPGPIRNYANRKVPECYIPTNGSFHHRNVPRIVIPRQQ